MIFLGMNYSGGVTAPKGAIRLSKDSTLLFKGTGAQIYQGVQIAVRSSAKLTLCQYSRIGDSAKIACRRGIYIGDMSRVAWESSISDSNAHYIEDLHSGLIANVVRPVYIDYCWIGNRTSIMPGTRLPSRTIVASNSLLNKDYIKGGIEPYSLIGGQPAKLIKSGVARIYDPDKEQLLHKYFRENECSSVNVDILNEIGNE